MIKKTIKVFLYFILFLFVGEMLIRIDIKFDLLNSAPKKISVMIERSNLLNLVDSGLFVPDSSGFRVMVIGDSYIHGGGIGPEHKFSKVLASILDSLGINKSIQILDVSRPSNNTQDNFNSLLFYGVRFQPDYVIWAYNFNDILGPIHGVGDEKTTTELVENEKAPIRIRKETKGIKELILNIYKLSELAGYLSSTLQKELKLKGIVIPAGDFYYLIKRAYLESNENWMKSKEIIGEAAHICDSYGATFILYKMPEFNLLSNRKLYRNADQALTSFVDTVPNIVYRDGFNDFNDGNGDQFMLSKYDGHPNVLAHRVIAESVSKFILLQEQSKKQKN